MQLSTRVLPLLPFVVAIGSGCGAALSPSHEASGAGLDEILIAAHASDAGSLPIVVQDGAERGIAQVESRAGVVDRESLCDPLRALAQLTGRTTGDVPGAEFAALTTLPPSATQAGNDHVPPVQFGGSGGPGGMFDWEIGTQGSVTPETFILDTTLAQITNSTHTNVQTVINGQVDVRHLVVWPNGTLIIQGPNPCVIRAAGTVTIHGKVSIKGFSSRGVVTFNTAHIPDPGASGHGGGGRGGDGSPLTTASDPKGGDGFGAFNTPGKGGIGGETGWCTGNIGCRRPGGGGGGRLGHDALRRAPNPNGCAEQAWIGLDAEKGFNGSPQPPPAGQTGGSAFGGAGVQPQGGAVGASPFVDTDASGAPIRRNDFWGAMITQSGELVLGELQRPWAGAGGGGGGDAVQVLASSPSFPQVPFDVNLNQKGAGGGGGGGSLTIFARGRIKLAGAGSIDASGGTGGGGENTNGINRVGGGSGGGSGGHIVLQTMSKIDLSEVVAPGSSQYPSPTVGGIYALGGQGGEGMGGVGGAMTNGVATAPHLDALPPHHYPSGTAADGPCAVAGNTVGNADPVNVVQCCGGDGGPGLIQLHAPALADIIPPVGVELYRVVKPHPVGSTPNNVNTPLAWDHLPPMGGRAPKQP